MSDSSKNRVAPSKTTRGSQSPHRNAGHNGIVQPALDNVQCTVTINEVQCILKLGQLLSSAITPDEHNNLLTNTSDKSNYVLSSILDEGLGVADDVRRLQI
jgi:hypothetical protein